MPSSADTAYDAIVAAVIALERSCLEADAALAERRWPDLESALRVLATWRGRRLALLGDMFELGVASQSEHARLGCALAASTDVLAVIGRDAQLAADSAIQEGFDARRVLRFPCDPDVEESRSAARAAATGWLRDTLQDGDLALIKASRGMGLDSVVGAIEEPA